LHGFWSLGLLSVGESGTNLPLGLIQKMEIGPTLHGTFPTQFAWIAAQAVSCSLGDSL